jgi:hypothetical protein
MLCIGPLPPLAAPDLAESALGDVLEEGDGFGLLLDEEAFFAGFAEEADFDGEEASVEAVLFLAG